MNRIESIVEKFPATWLTTLTWSAVVAMIKLKFGENVLTQSPYERRALKPTTKWSPAELVIVTGPLMATGTGNSTNWLADIVNNAPAEAAIVMVPARSLPRATKINSMFVPMAMPVPVVDMYVHAFACFISSSPYGGAAVLVQTVPTLPVLFANM